MCFPGSDIIMTYDYNQFIYNIYKHPDKRIIGWRYSTLKFNNYYILIFIEMEIKKIVRVNNYDKSSTWVYV